MLYHPARDLILKTERDITPEALRRAMDRELRRDGMVLGDPEVLRAMEHSALEAPCFLPIQVNKDGGISGGVATAAQLGRLGQYVEKLLHQITRELRQGNIDADPCWRGAAGERLHLLRFCIGLSLPGRAGRRPAATAETGEARRVLGICSA